jgi:Porin subfamily
MNRRVPVRVFQKLNFGYQCWRWRAAPAESRLFYCVLRYTYWTAAIDWRSVERLAWPIKQLAFAATQSSPSGWGQTAAPRGRRRDTRASATVAFSVAPNPQPIQYVKICSLYGVGFYYIPGTDMCIKVGGWARYENGFGYNGSFTTEFYDNNINNRNTIGYHERVKGTATFDARSPTEYGTVRSYIALGISTNNAQGSSGSNGTSGYNNRWFIQWAGFTIGHSTSFYDFYSIGGNQYGFVTASSDSGDGGWDVFGYTANFGNGLSATLSAESQRVTSLAYTGTGAGVAGALGGAGGLAFNSQGLNYQAQQVPDVVANLRVDQAWGSAQIMGALHSVAATYYGNPGGFTAGFEGAGHPGDKLGFAVGAGIKLNAPMIGKGDYFQAEVDYTEGASRYSNMTAIVWDFRRYEGSNFGFGFETDAVYGGSVTGGGASDLELTTTWAVNAAYTHNWNAAWKSTLWGSYRAESYNSSANAMLCSAINDGNGARGIFAVANSGCDMNWDAWGLGLRTEWAVSSTLQLGLEVMYANLNSATTSTGLIGLAADGSKPAGTYTIADQDLWAIRFRLNRPFYP